MSSNSIYNKTGFYSVQEGKTASLALVRANPLEDTQSAPDIEGVFLRGEYFYREDLDRLLEEARDLAISSEE